MEMLQHIREFFTGRGKDESTHLEDYVGRLNANLGVLIGAGLTVLELVLLCAAVANRATQFNMGKVMAYLGLGVLSAVLVVVSRHRLRRRHNDRLFVLYITAYLLAAAAYGIHNSLQDLAQDKQIITFMLVMMMDTCIFATPPMGVVMLTTGSYVAMFVLGLSGGRMDVGSLVNFWLSYVVVTAAGFMRYHECWQGANNESKLQHASEHDGLTGLRNRMALRQDFSRLCGRDQYVMMLDLDDFKQINDTFGHEAGDTVLCAYAEALHEVFPQATCYRYGGDEFLVVAPVRDLPNIKGCIKLLRKRIRTILLVDGRQIRAGTSVGCVRGIANNEGELRELIQRADVRLYSSKRQRKAGRRVPGEDAGPTVQGEGHSAGRRRDEPHA